MKTLKYNILKVRNLKVSIIALLLISTSCKDDFFNPRSLSTFDQAAVYSNLEDARRGVNAIYVPFGKDGFRSRLSNNMTGNTDIEHQSGYSQLDGGRREIWNINAQPNNGDLRQFWNAAYEGIRNANFAIEGITASELFSSQDETVSSSMKHLLGEAYTLRAYWYSMLTYYFGDVPAEYLSPIATSEFIKPRSNRNEILSKVIQDMIDIEADMKWADQLPYGIEQVSREFTLGLIARISLQRGGYYLTPDMQMMREADYLDYYDIARTYTKKLMDLKDRPLTTGYKQVFLNNAKFINPVNDDILFEIPFALGNGDVGWNIGIEVKGGATATHDYGSGNNYMNIPATYYFSFDTLDVRRDVTCAFYYVNENFEESYIGDDVGRGSDAISQGKWSRYYLEDPPGKNSAKGTGINWPMLRYSDVLLMFAEAENELFGPTDLAKEALSRVRSRAFDEQYWDEKVTTYVNNVAASKETFFNALVDERAWEFGGEMIRKYELIRWNLYYDKMNETVEGLKALADHAFNGTPVSGFSYNLPDYFFWKRDANGNFTILNPNKQVLVAPDETWNRDGFLIDLHDDQLTYDEWITRDWENYINPSWGHTGVVRYIFPIPQEAITNSQGAIDNQGYEFNF